MRRLNTGEWIAVTLALIVVAFMFVVSLLVFPTNNVSNVEIPTDVSGATTTTETADATTTIEADLSVE